MVDSDIVACRLRFRLVLAGDHRAGSDWPFFGVCMTEEEKLELQAKVEGRKAANACADLYVSESARLNQEHGKYGQAAAIEFLETLRDALILIRPIMVVPANVDAMIPQKAALVSEWKEWKVPDRFTLVEFDDKVVASTDKAVLIGDRWIPNACLYEIPQPGQDVKCWPVLTDFAQKKGWID